jgi:hypothetical protein
VSRPGHQGSGFLTTPVRTLDALHLAWVEFLRGHGQDVALASYDERQRTAAKALDIPLHPLV